MTLKKSVSDFEVKMHSDLKDQVDVPSRYEFLKAHNGIRPNCLHGLISSTGCLSGDTIVRLNRNGNGRRYSLSELCRKFGNVDGVPGSFEKIEHNRIRTYIEDEDRIGLKHFLDVVYSGDKETYSLELMSGHNLRATSCHMIMTKRGYVPLGELSSDDMVMIDESPRAISKGVLTPKKYDYHLTVGEYHPYAQRVPDKRCNTHRLRIEKHRLIYEAHLNGMTTKEFQDATKEPNDLKYIDPSVYDIHHIDYDHYNNDVENLVHLTKSEHQKLHSEHNKKNFNQGEPGYSGIKSIKYYGVEPTYDVRNVRDTDAFTANDIVVHNSGKSTLLKCIIAETAIHKKCLVWLSEENIVEYQELINYLDKSVLDNIVWVEEKEISDEYKENVEKFHEYFEQMVDESGCDIVFIDNVTSSAFYNARFGFYGQNKTSDYLMHFVKRKCAVFYIAHTSANVTENYGKIITPEDIRGSKELPLVTEYFYIIQKFTSNDKIYNILKVAKYRHHETAAGYYALKFEKRAYIGDAKVPFELINKIFKGRDYLGRALQKKKKDETPPKERKEPLL